MKKTLFSSLFAVLCTAALTASANTPTPANPLSVVPELANASFPELRDALKLPPLDKKYCTPLSTPVPTAEPEYSLDNVPQLGKRQLKEKSEGEDVYWLQKTLKDLGYYDTKVTGKMLKKTVKAVKAFQQDHGLKANGGVTQELIDLIAETARNAKNPQETPAPIATPEP